MTTYEWLGLIAVLIAGFWKLCNKLSKIEIAISGKVGIEECRRHQRECPCHEQLRELETLVEKLHPHQVQVIQ